MVAVVTDLNRQKINEYIWTVYVENQKAPFGPKVIATPALASTRMTPPP